MKNIDACEGLRSFSETLNYLAHEVIIVGLAFSFLIPVSDLGRYAIAFGVGCWAASYLASAVRILASTIPITRWEANRFERELAAHRDLAQRPHAPEAEDTLRSYH